MRRKCAVAVALLLPAGEAVTPGGCHRPGGVGLRTGLVGGGLVKAVFLALLAIGIGSAVWARDAKAGGMQEQLDALKKRIEEQDQIIDQLLRRERERQADPVAAPAPEKPPVQVVPASAPEDHHAPGDFPPAVTAAAPKPAPAESAKFEAGYDKGFYIRSVAPAKIPYSLRINSRMQFRYTNFQKNSDNWTDNAGVTRSVKRRSDFEIERGRLTFEGTALDPRLGYYINLDMDTDDNHDVIAHDYWMDWKFDKAFDLFAGKGMVPGSRDWLNGSTRTRLVDRSMATTYFRPDRTVGLWAKGEPLDNLFYHALVGNGFSTSDLNVNQIDDSFVYSMTVWDDLAGNYGSGYSDLEWHTVPAGILGGSFTFAQARGVDTSGNPNGESNFLRLSDGTRLTNEGALAPDTVVDSGDLYLWAIDAAGKYRGFSADAEYFFRWINDVSAQGSGSLPLDQFFDHGFYFETGYMVIPKFVELNARTSWVFGRFGDQYEYAGGANWFVNGTHNLKLSLDVTRVNRSPVDNSGTNYRAGDDGVMVRTQIQAGF